MVSFVPCTVTRGYKKPPGTRFPSPLRAPPLPPVPRHGCDTAGRVCEREAAAPRPAPLQPGLANKALQTASFRTGKPLRSLALLTRGLTRSFARGFARSLAWHRAATRRGWRLPGRSCERLLCLVSLSLSLSLHWTCISLRWETLRGSMQGRAAGRATRKAADKAAALCRAQPTGPRRPISAR
jgi:hypothetical protein